jgi:signal transduction histidine kinase
VRQPPQASASGAHAAPPRAPLDALRLEQFIDLQRGLLVSAADPETLAERLVQGATLLLRVKGAAVGVVAEGRYRLLATYGLDAEYRAQYDGRSVQDASLGPALAAGRPLVLASLNGSAAALRTVLLPFELTDGSGALHLVFGDERSLTDDDLEMARTIALLVGVALGSARQRRRLVDLARLKGDALTAMAHDLRAPLNALLGYTSLLAEGAFGPLTDEQRDIATTLERQAVELVDLLGATLDVVRLETGRLPVRVEEFSLAEVVTSLLAGTFAHPTRSGRLHCNLPADLPPLHTDRGKVKQIVQNLIDNALKHGGGGRVELEIAFAPGRNLVHLAVRDQGPGIAPDLLPHVFEPFRRGSERGTGFGLYLVRSFAEALGGRVVAQSQPDRGTTVRVELPRVAPGAAV